MAPRRAVLRSRVTWLALSSAGLAVIVGLGLILTGGLPLPKMPAAVAVSFFYGVCIGLPLMFLLPALSQRIWHWPLTVRCGVTVVVTGTVSVVGTGVALAARAAAGWLAWSELLTRWRADAGLAVLIAVVAGIIVPVIIDLSMRLRTTQQTLAERELARIRAIALAQEAQLSSLSARVQPHFLFNALNTVGALIRFEPKEAERTVERLAHLLRFSLDAPERDTVPLSRELDLVRDYLAIEQLRYGDRLKVSFEVPGSLSDVAVPPFCVQTLVENCIKHVVAHRREPTHVMVRARAGEEDHVVVEISDDGPGFSGDPRRAGHGLDLLHRRLDALFGPEAALTWCSATTGSAVPDSAGPGAQVRMRLPRQRTLRSVG